MPAVIRFAGEGLKPFALRLERFGDNTQNAEPAFNEMADFVATVFDSQFRTRGGRMGSKWAPLSPRYAAQKARKFPNMPLMVATGDLRKSLALRPFGIDEVTNKGMTVGTGVEHAGYHQRGGDNLPQRKLIGTFNRQDRKELSSILHRHLMEGVTQ